MNTRTLVFCLVGAVCMTFTAGVVVDCDHLPEPLKDPHACCPTPHCISDQLIEKCKQMEGSSSESHESDENDANKVKPHVHHHHRHAEAAHEQGTTVFQRLHALLHRPRFIKCVFTETGIVENEKLNEVKLSEHLKVAMKDAPEMIPVYEQSFKSCVAKYEDFKAKKADSPHHHHHAEPMVMACVFKESFKNCAPSLWSNTEECNEWREVLTTCKQDSHFWHNIFHHVSDSSEEDKA